MKQIPCPFCGEDQAAQHHATLRHGVTFDRMMALLCVDCGEPICITPTGFRKPTADEYVLMSSDSRLALARGAWLQLKKDRRPPIRDMWQRYAEDMLDDFRLKNIKSNHELMVYAQDIFLSGVTLALALFNRNLNDAESSEEFTASMLVIEAELKAVAEAMNPEGAVQ